jgi:hypothetical protein
VDKQKLKELYNQFKTERQVKEQQTVVKEVFPARPVITVKLTEEYLRLRRLREERLMFRERRLARKR